MKVFFPSSWLYCEQETLDHNLSRASLANSEEFGSEPVAIKDQLAKLIKFLVHVSYEIFTS